MSEKGLGFVAGIIAVVGIGYVLLTKKDIVEDVVNNVSKNVSKVTVSQDIYKVPDAFNNAIDTSVKATQTIVDVIKDAGGVVSSGAIIPDTIKTVTVVIGDTVIQRTEDVAKIINSMKDIVAYQVPGWMPVGEV